MDLCKICNKKEKLRADGFCSTSCFNKTKIKDISGYKKCLLCRSEFPYRETLVFRSAFSKKYNCFVGSINQKYCSQKCALMDRNINNNPAKTEDVRKKISNFAKKRGTEHLRTPERRLKQRNSIKGDKHWNWQGGKTDLNRILRNSYEAKKWRIDVFTRDNWTCVLCHARNGNGFTVKLNADHIKSWHKYPELRFELSNGRTLCLECHKKTDNFAGRARNSK